MPVPRRTSSAVKSTLSFFDPSNRWISPTSQETTRRSSALNTPRDRGETTGDIGRLESLKIGTLTIPHPPVVFSRDTTGVFAGSDEAGIVGGELLRRCRVTFDYPHGRLYLEPYRDEFSGLEYDMSGMFLIATGPQFSHVTVQSVADGTPASEAGISKGDEIVAIDGRSTAGRTLDDVREQFKMAGATRRLDVKHGDEKRAVQLALRRLV
jgi:hypothetical protein